MLNSGFSHLCHHNVHWERCTDYVGRLAYLKAHKPVAELGARLRWFALVPDERLPLALRQAWVACDKAREVYDQAWWAYSKAQAAYSKAQAACDKAREVYDQAWWAYSKARTACDKAWAAAAPELAVLHDELFPDCPWNEEQQTMFPAGEKK